MALQNFIGKVRLLVKIKPSELINRIEKESIRMSTLVEDLLLLARLDQSRELANDPVDLNTLITEVIASATSCWA